MEKQEFLNKLAEFLHETIAENFDISFALYTEPEKDKIHIDIDFDDDSPINWESEEVQDILYEIINRPTNAVGRIEE